VGFPEAEQPFQHAVSSRVSGEEASLLMAAAGLLTKRSVEKGHWDGVISSYREVEVAPERLSETLFPIFERMRTRAAEFQTSLGLAIPGWLPDVHILELLPEGEIKYHIDNGEAFGSAIATLSLGSDAMMRFDDRATGHGAKLFVPRRSLYVMSDYVRYRYGHAVLNQADSTFKGVAVPRQRRVSFLQRSHLPSVHRK